VQNSARTESQNPDISSSYHILLDMFYVVLLMKTAMSNVFCCNLSIKMYFINILDVIINTLSIAESVLQYVELVVCNITIFTALAETLDCKICVSREKKSILECLEDVSLCQRLTLAKHEARVHVVAMNQVNSTVCYGWFLLFLVSFVI